MTISFYQYDIITSIGDFNSEPDETFMSDLMKLYNFKNLLKLRTCYKNAENPSYIGLFLINRWGCFQDNCVFETGISDFHKLVLTVLRNHLKKLEPKTEECRPYEKFYNEEFRLILLNKLMCGDSQSKQLHDLIDSVLHFVAIKYRQKYTILKLMKPRIQLKSSVS